MVSTPRPNNPNVILFDNGTWLEADTSGNVSFFNSSGTVVWSVSPTGRITSYGGTATQGIGSGGATYIAQTSAGLTGGGNLNPGFTPAANADVVFQGTANVTSYSSGSLGFALNAVYSTAGASATNYFAPLRKLASGSGANISSTAATAGIYSFMLHMKSSGGKSLQPKATVGGGNSLKYTVDWELVEYQ